MSAGIGSGPATNRCSGLAGVLGLLLVFVTAGCSAGDSGSDQPAGTSSALATTTTQSAVPTSTGPPPPGPPVVADAPCPYLEQGFIEETIGQRMERVETITVDGQPAPNCVFYRPDGSAAVTIDLTPYPDPVAAQNAALALVTTSAMPITDIGDYGGVIVSSRQTLLAVTTGPLLLTVTTNQESSLQAREVATTVLAALATLPPA
ncbi:MAG: DUF2020 domain-containing protein [Actinomycetota bacterium]|nr:DUF2020 domain-containing protein [Actinomycetota bacterium]